MRLGVPQETGEGETRVALVPEVVKRLVGKGLEVRVQPGAGARALIPDEAFAEAGAELSDDVWTADVVLKVAPPTGEEIARLGTGSVLVGFLNPLVYEVGRENKKGQGPGNVLLDVTRGNNDLGSMTAADAGGGKPLGCCSAAVGYDSASGWGSLQMVGLAKVGAARFDSRPAPAPKQTAKPKTKK